MANTKITASLLDPAQTSITSLGTLSALTISGDLTVDTSTLKVDSSNNRVGIGTASPARSLDVNSGSAGVAITTKGSGTGSYITFQDGTTTNDAKVRVGAVGDELLLFAGGSTRVTVDSSGRVGIDEGDPDYHLHISNSSQVGLKVEGSGAGYVQGSILLSSATSGSNDYRGHGIFYWNNTSQTEWFLGAPYTDSDRFVINRKASQSTADFSSAYIHASHGQNFLTIENDGKVGIGTTVPVAPLHVYNSSGGNATSKAEMLSEAVVKLQPHTSNSTNMLFAQVDNGSSIGIQVTNGPATANWDLSLSPFGGRVGIGEVAPDAMLHVKHAGGGFDEVARLTAVANSAGDGAFLGFHGNSTSKFYGFIGGYDINTNQGGIKIGVGNGETAIADSMTKMTINNSGHIGIGTTTLNKFFNLADPNNGGEENKLHFEATGVTHWAIYPYDRVNNHYPSLHLGQNENLKILNTGAVQIGNSSDGVLFQAKPSDGRVGIGTTQPGGKFMIEANGQNIDLFVLNNTRSGSNSTAIQQFKREGTNTGYIANTSSATSYNTSQSDRRAKKNFEDWTENVLPYFKDLKPTKFHFTQEDDSGEKNKGYIAQDLVGSFPEAYPIKDTGEDAGRYFFNPSGMVVYLMKAVQELSAEVESLKEKLNG